MEFSTRDDDGNEVMLYVTTEEVDVPSRKVPGGRTPGMKTITTEDGLSINRLAKGKYQVVQTGKILASDDPNAP